LGDGELACFDGARRSNLALINAALKASGTMGWALTNSPHSGFQRLSAHRTVLVIDTGARPGDGPPTIGCAGTLSFELSVGKQRLVVNCGLPPGHNQKQIYPFRSSDAHSTLTIAHTNSSQVNKDGKIGPRCAEPSKTLRR